MYNVGTMQNPLRNVVALSALLFVFACSAWPQAATDAQQCIRNQADPETTLQYCTAALASGQVPADELADAFHTRGNAYRPFILTGQPVDVQTTINVVFALNE